MPLMVCSSSLFAELMSISADLSAFASVLASAFASDFVSVLAEFASGFAALVCVAAAVSFFAKTEGVEMKLLLASVISEIKSAEKFVFEFIYLSFLN